MRIAILAATIALSAAGLSAAADVEAAVRQPTNIPAQDLGPALRSLAKERRFQIVYASKDVAELQTQGAVGELTVDEALSRILSGTGFTFRYIDEKTVTIVPMSDSAAGKDAAAAASGEVSLMLFKALRLAQADEPGKQTNEEPQRQQDTQEKAIPEMLVQGSRTLNADIKRTEDAPQPYVVFSSEEIQSSQALNLEDFLRTRLPMNTAAGTVETQFTGNLTPSSGINLRGLGSNQTLILVDGRRMPGVAHFGEPYQPTLNGVPMAAVERIEILPATAGGIYGGSATGGVINVVLKKDFRGVETKAAYGNTFDTDASTVNLDISGGFSLEGGRTQVMIAASRSDSNYLTIKDRDFARRARALQMANNPDAFTLYPPIGGTVNVLSASGDPLVLDPGYGNTPLGSTYTHIPLGYEGPDSDDGEALVANAGSFNLDVPPGLSGGDLALNAGPLMESAMISVRRSFGKRLEAFVDYSNLSTEATASYGYMDTGAYVTADAPNNPFQQDVYVRFPTPNLAGRSNFKSDLVRATAGLIARLPRDWVGEVDYNWSRSRYVSGSEHGFDDDINSILNSGEPAPDGRPALNVFQEANTFPLDYSSYLKPSPYLIIGPTDTVLKDVTLRFSGPVAALPGGTVTLSTLIERRNEEIEDAILSRRVSVDPAVPPLYVLTPHRSQAADSYSAEARIPLISSLNALPFVRELELQVSARRDEYEVQSVPSSASAIVPSPDGPFPEADYTTVRLHSNDYTVGLRYAPHSSVALRASFGTGFLPPSVTQISPSSFLWESGPFIADPKRGGESGPYVGGDSNFEYIYGGNASLRPEESESWSAGFIFTPGFAPGLRLSIDYTQIDKTDEIQSPDAGFMFDNEDTLPAGRIVRGPNLPGDQPGWAGPVTAVDTSFINIAKTSVEAFDIQADYMLRTERLGELRFYTLATWQPHYQNQVLPTSQMLDSVGFDGGVLEWRGNMGIDWSKGPLMVRWNAQYYDNYRVYSVSASPGSVEDAVLSQGSEFIPSQMYHDLIATYRFDLAASTLGGLLDGTEISLGIQNVLDKSPPIVASTAISNSNSSVYGDPRMRRYTLSMRKSFGRN